MTLTDRAVLEIDPIGDAEAVGVFVFVGDFSITTEIERQYIMSESGQYISQIADQFGGLVPDSVADVDFDHREGYHVDGGAGSVVNRLEASRRDNEESQWGDGSATGGEATKYDAAGAPLRDQMDVFGHWIAQTRSDSGGQTRLYIGNHSDGTYADSAGVFGEPIPVAIRDVTLSKDENASSTFDITIEMVRTALIPSVREALEEIASGVYDAANDVLASLTDEIPDF